MQISKRDRIILALTVYGEARGEPREGKAGVVWTVLHRAANPRWWGRSVASCCLTSYQFSCWNESDPNRATLMRQIGHDLQRAELTETARRNEMLLDCLAVVNEVLDGEIPDPTGGATHYCTRAVASRTSWARGREPSAEIGAHLFFAGVEPDVVPYRIAPTSPPGPKPGFFMRIWRWLKGLLR